MIKKHFFKYVISDYRLFMCFGFLLFSPFFIYSMLKTNEFSILMIFTIFMTFFIIIPEYLGFDPIKWKIENDIKIKLSKMSIDDKIKLLELKDDKK